MGRHAMSDRETVGRLEFAPTGQCEESNGCTGRGTAYVRCRGCGDNRLLCSKCVAQFVFAARYEGPGLTPCCGREGTLSETYTLHSAIDGRRIA